MSPSSVEIGSSKLTMALRGDQCEPGKQLTVLVKEGAVQARAFEPLGVMIYDPGYMNTAVIRSGISFIDGDAGILEYRGYKIEELAERSHFLEVAYLLIYGRLPCEQESRHWQDDVMSHTYVDSKMIGILQSFHQDAHPMGVFIG
jgi:citrate synthase